MRRTAALIGIAAIGMAASGVTPGVHADARGVHALDVYGQGDVVDVLVFADTPDGPQLQHQRSRDGARRWSPPVTIDRGGRGIVKHHRGSDPQIAAIADVIVVLWTQPGTSAWGEGPLATAISRDGGRTWQSGTNPADDRSSNGHAFIALTTDRQGRFQAVWLDSRDGGQGLRGATSADGGRTWSKNVSIDTRTCECCWNESLSTGPGEFLVLYRDKDPRDMALAASTDGGGTWTRRSVVGGFNWMFNGCPHVGGGLAKTASALHAIVWTGKESEPGVYALRSHDTGQTWSTPRRLGDASARNTGLAASGRSLVATWDESTAGTRRIVTARSDDEGASWSQPKTLSADGQLATHPLVVATHTGYAVFWTERAGKGPPRWTSALIP
jgi:hypothetical protein